MKLVVVSPEYNRPDEVEVLGELFAAGLKRYHVRKPHVSVADLETWIRQVPAVWRSRLVLHQHHELVDALGLGGRHWRDAVGQLNLPAEPLAAARSDDALGRNSSTQPEASSSHFTSRSCHDVAKLRASLGLYDSVFFGPVFPSISKPGYFPQNRQIGEVLGIVLTTRTLAERRTRVYAIGGITTETVSRAVAFGFDGVAALGAIWQAADPVRAFRELRAFCGGGFLVRRSFGEGGTPRTEPDESIGFAESLVGRELARDSESDTSRAGSRPTRQTVA